MSIGRNTAALDRLVAELQEPAARLGGEHWSPEREWCAARLAQLLARTELRAWLVETADEPGVLTACCPLDTGRALVAYAREPMPAPVPGGYVVGRSVPFGPRRYLLIGRAAVVKRGLAPEFSSLIASLRAPRGEFWHVHGAVLARAAWSLAAEAGRADAVQHAA